MRLAVDCVTLSFDRGALFLLLVERKNPPFQGKRALPGGFVEENESVELAARRELLEETAVETDRVEQLAVFSDPGRDPRGRVVSVAHLALVRRAAAEPRAGSDASSAAWIPIRQAKDLAFDHDQMVALALARLSARAESYVFGEALLPERFTLSDLQALTEVLLGRSLDKRNFRRKVLDTGVLIATGEREQGVAHRAAQLYRFDRRRTRGLDRRWQAAD